MMECERVGHGDERGPESGTRCDDGLNEDWTRS